MTMTGDDTWLAHWAMRIAKAQWYTARTIDGVAYARVPWDGDGPCGDCGAEPGDLHVPFCDLEPCPKCGAQALTCEHAIGLEEACDGD
jgi:hypothetical protein